MAKRSSGAARPGHVRIIAGTWRGRRLAIPAASGVRPTPDRVRETLFNWLSPFIGGAKCLDLYAGTGALGLEALSRGAAETWLVERDRRLAQALEAHAKALGAPARVVQADAVRLLAEHSADAAAFGGFDVVFLDPPYDVPLEPLLGMLPRFLAPKARLYVERPRDPGLPDASPYGTWLRTSRAGAISFGLLEIETTPAGNSPFRRARG
jgi:16S rRNA (guanine966-N2)-methyltransferase